MKYLACTHSDTNHKDMWIKVSIKIFQVWLMPISGTACTHMHVLKTGLVGRFAVSVVDDLVVVHHQVSYYLQPTFDKLLTRLKSSMKNLIKMFYHYLALTHTQQFKKKKI